MFFFAAITSVILNVIGVSFLESLITFSLIFLISNILAYIFFELFEKKEKESVKPPIKNLFFPDE